MTPPPSASVRSNLKSFLRRHMFETFFLLLLVQFVLWVYLAYPKSSSPLGRRDLGSVSNQTDCHRKEWLEHEVERVMHQEGFMANGWVNGMQEEASESTISETNMNQPRRKERTEETSLTNPPSTVPSVDDVYTRLKDYLIDLERNHFLTDLHQAKTLQQHTTSAELGVLAVDHLAEIDSIPTRIDFLNNLARKVGNQKIRVSIVTTSSVDLFGVRSELLPWMQYHTELGIAHFYILYDGSDSVVVDTLSRIHHVTLIQIHSPFASEKELVEFATWSQSHLQWGGKPGNFELMVKQGYGLTKGLELAKRNGDDWLMHLDPDELFYPDNGGYSLLQEFLNQPDHVSSIRFMNFEGQPEFGDVINRYEQVTLFRCHKYFISSEANFLRNRCKLGDNRTFLVLYANGKSAVRVNAPGVKQLGPHFFTGHSSDRWKTESNPLGLWKDKISNSSFILHYGYSYLSDVSNKAKRSCPGDEFEAAATKNQSQLGNCFLIDFDRDAYVAAITGEDEDFFYSRQVLSEGARIKCRKGKQSGWCIVYNVDYFKYILTKSGLLRRVREPQQILKMHERLIQMKEKEEFGGLDLEEESKVGPKEAHS